MPLTAIISDIHGNKDALDAVVQDARAAGAERFLCLGDVVGYGAQPLECLDLVRQLCTIVIKGNHEVAVLRGPLGFNPLASAAIRWTRALLDARGGDDLAYLQALPERHDVPGEPAILYHGSPRHPTEEYLFREDTLDHLPRSVDYSPKLVACFQEIDRPCFIGHTHVPGVIESDMTWCSPEECEQRYDTANRPCFVNVGSVGQPRDGDRRASYALFDGRLVTFRRVRYDVEAAAERIFATPELPDLLGQRLLEGW